jgi:hypothetical protein
VETDTNTKTDTSQETECKVQPIFFQEIGERKVVADFLAETMQLNGIY